uniref:Lipase member H n=3 Tax=Lygus hesperus TaxID=30085 RepID=A0A0A9WIP6_LYGHE
MKMAMTKFMYMMIFCLSTSIEATEMWRSMLDSIDSIMDITEMSDTQDCSSVRFYVSSRSNNYKTVQVWTGDWRSLSFAGLDRDERIVVLVHGFSNNHSSPAMETLKEGIRGRSISYIGVDWSDIAITVNYPFVASKVRAIGYCLADFLYFLISETAIRLNNLHLVGHSLGAHVSGFAGKTLKANGFTAARVTGLDPALPGFNGDDDSSRLASTDGKFVDCIHTCGGLLGFDVPICQADFFPNGGINVQPGCDWFDFGACSHGRSFEFFAESINPTHHFYSEACNAVVDGTPYGCVNDGAEMGFFAKPQNLGEFYLTTRSSSPFSTNITSSSD